MGKEPDVTLKRDRLRDLLMFRNCEVFKHEVHILPLILLVY
jgi:hypothetical protein